MKRIVLHVEGEGESIAVPRLVKRILTEKQAWDTVTLDPNTFRVGQIHKLLKNNYAEWKRKLRASLKRKDVGGVLLLLDGDLKMIGKEPFCAAQVARSLAAQAVEVGGGTTFSVAIVFARQEYETWLIAGIESFVNQRLPDGRLIAKAPVAPPYEDLEERPRDAKGWLSNVIEGGYKPTRDQAALTDILDFELVRQRNIRSFRRLESAVEQLVLAIRNRQHLVTPI